MLYLSRAGYKDGASFRDRKVIKFGSNINISFQRDEEMSVKLAFPVRWPGQSGDADWLAAVLIHTVPSTSSAGSPGAVRQVTLNCCTLLSEMSHCMYFISAQHSGVSVRHLLSSIVLFFRLLQVNYWSVWSKFIVNMFINIINFNI